jgi:hypothetical protein
VKARNEYQKTSDAVLQSRKNQIPAIEEAKKQGDMKPIELFLKEDNAILDVKMKMFAKENALKRILD